MNGKQIPLKARVVEMLEMYNRVYRNTVEMDMKFIVALLIGIMSSGTENITKKCAYDLVATMYMFRVNNDGNRMSYFPRYFQNGLKFATATIKKARENRENAH